MAKPNTNNVQVSFVTKDDENPVPVEILEHAIIEIAAGMKKLGASRLKREAVVALLHDASKISKTDIRTVLMHMDNLEQTFLKPKA